MGWKGEGEGGEGRRVHVDICRWSEGGRIGRRMSEEYIGGG